MAIKASCALFLTITAVVGVAACATHPSRVAPFRQRSDSAEAGQLAGPFSGEVVDAATRSPVTGALVYATWSFEAGTGFVIPAGSREFVGSTDSRGHYTVPAVVAIAGARLVEFNILVYKRGFVAYRSDRRFHDLGLRMDFAQQNNQVVLERWRDDFSHIRHIRYVGGGAAIAGLTQWELADAAEEMVQLNQPNATPRPSTGTLVVSAQLLAEQDIRDITKYDGAFETGPLQDEPDTATYSSQHFKAIGREETWDVALRVWRLPGGKSVERYEELMGQMPSVTEKDDIANRSFITSAGEIRGVGFVDVQRGLVAIVTCGTSICSSPDQATAMAKVIHSKLQRLLPGTGVSP